MAKTFRPKADFETSPPHLIDAREKKSVIPKGIHEFAQPQYSLMNCRGWIMYGHLGEQKSSM